jgi:hypothetical protein
LDEAAAPLQSWRRKNVRGYFGATITGALGLAVAREIPVERTQADQKARAGTTLAPSLTLGVDAHYGLGGCRLARGCRLGMLFNIVDLGALVSVRLSNPTSGANEAQAEATPEVRFEQVLAPGLMPYFGWGPLDIGVLVGFVPSLRPAHGAETRNVEALNVVRLGAVLSVDISILPLF